MTRDPGPSPLMTPWNQVTIIGTGLVGGSLGLALKAAGLTARIVGVGHRQVTLDEAMARGAADAVTLDASAGVRGSDLVVLATAVGLFEATLRQVAGHLEAGAVVIDLGSTKADVVRTLEPLMPDGCTFVGCHPIAGSEKRGIAYAQADLFQGATCVVTPTGRTPPDVLRRVVDTWEGLGMAVRQVSPAVHDRLLAEVSHLPHVVASVLVQAVGKEAERLIGPGWADTTRVASGDPALWRDILMSNSAGIAAAIETYQQVLTDLRAAVSQRDAARIEAFLAEAKQRRDRLIRQKNHPAR